MRVDTVALLQLDGTDEHLIATVAVGLEQQIPRPVRSRLGDGLAGRVAESRQPMVTDRVDPTTTETSVLRENGIRTLLAAPMLAGGTLVGVLRVGAGGDRMFTEQDIGLLQVAANRIG